VFFVVENLVVENQTENLTEKLAAFNARADNLPV